MRKCVALFVSACFILCDSLAYSFPATEKNVPVSQPFLSFPPDFGSVEESHRGTSGKTVIYIQDAHDSLEAQENIARIIEYSVEKAGVKTVFEEGDEGPVSTDRYFGDISGPGIKQKVAYFLLDQLRLGGAEYAHVLRRKDFKLIGADDNGLHLKTLAAYRKAARAKKEIRWELALIQKETDRLAKEYFPAPVKAWMRIKNRFDRGELDLLNYLKRMVSLGSAFPGARYPLISLFLEAGNSKDPALLAKAREIRPLELFREIEKCEQDWAREHLTGDHARTLFRLCQGLGLLNRLNELRLTPSEFEAAREILAGFKTADVARLIAKMGRRAVVLSQKWETAILAAMNFYETALARDRAVESCLRDFLKNPDEDTAILVFGGFHKDPILEMLRRRGFSYGVVSPRISGPDEKHRRDYTRLMSGGYPGIETSAVLNRASRTLSICREAALLGEEAVRSEIAMIAEIVREENPSEPGILNRIVGRRLARRKGLGKSDEALTGSLRSEIRGQASSGEKYFQELRDNAESDIFRDEVFRGRPLTQPEQTKILNLVRAFEAEIRERGEDRHLFRILEDSRSRISSPGLKGEVEKLIALFRKKPANRALDKREILSNLAYQALVWTVRVWPKKDVHTHVSPSIHWGWQVRFLVENQKRFRPLFEKWKREIDEKKPQDQKKAAYRIMEYFLARPGEWKDDKSTRQAIREIYSDPLAGSKSDALDFMVQTNRDFAETVRHVVRQYFEDGVREVYLQFNPVKDYSPSVHTTLRAVHRVLKQEEARAGLRFGGVHKVYFDFSFNREKRDLEPVERAVSEIGALLRGETSFRPAGDYRFRLHGFDLSGPEKKDGRFHSDRPKWKKILREVKRLGLRVKTHVGDATNTNLSVNDQLTFLEETLDLVRPQGRIGHAMILAPLVEQKGGYIRNPAMDRVGPIVEKLKKKKLSVETSLTDNIFAQRGRFRVYYWRRQGLPYIPVVDGFRYHTGTLSRWLVNLLLCAPEKEKNVEPLSVREIREIISPEVRSEVRSKDEDPPYELVPEKAHLEKYLLEKLAYHPDVRLRFDKEWQSGRLVNDTLEETVPYFKGYTRIPGVTAGTMGRLTYFRIGSWRFVDHRIKKHIEPLLAGEYAKYRKRVLYLHELEGSLINTEEKQNLQVYAVPMIMAVTSLDLKAKRVLDLGSGSGELDLVAHRKQALSTLVDIDPAHEQVLEKHLAANSIPIKAETFRFVEADINGPEDLLAKLGGKKFDVIFANIGEHPIYQKGTHLNAIRLLKRFDADTYVLGGYGLGIPGQDEAFKQAEAELAKLGFEEAARFSHESLIFPREEVGRKTAVIFRKTRSEMRPKPPRASEASDTHRSEMRRPRPLSEVLREQLPSGRSVFIFSARDLYFDDEIPDRNPEESSNDAPLFSTKEGDILILKDMSSINYYGGLDFVTSRLEAHIRQRLKSVYGLTPAFKQKESFKTIIEELVKNAIIHGNQRQYGSEIGLRWSVDKKQERLALDVIDEGRKPVAFETDEKKVKPNAFFIPVWLAGAGRGYQNAIKAYLDARHVKTLPAKRKNGKKKTVYDHPLWDAKKRAGQVVSVKLPLRKNRSEIRSPEDEIFDKLENLSAGQSPSYVPALAGLQQAAAYDLLEAIERAAEAVKKAAEAPEIHDQVNLLLEMRRAQINLQHTVGRLREKGFADVAQIVERLYPMVLPHLIRARRFTPVNHATHVMEFMAEIMAGNASQTEMKRGVVAALMHDMGYGLITQDQVTKAEIMKAPAGPERERKRQLGIRMRRSHMVRGSSLAGRILADYNARYPGTFSGRDIRAIRHVIANHDNPSIQAYEERNNGRWLFKTDDRLSMFHREADRMMMLIEDAVSMQVSASTREKALKFVDRFYEEMELYREAFPDAWQGYGFKNGTLFRTDKGHEIFERLKKEIYEKFAIPESKRRSEARQDSPAEFEQGRKSLTAQSQNHLNFMTRLRIPKEAAYFSEADAGNVNPLVLALGSPSPETFVRLAARWKDWQAMFQKQDPGIHVKILASTGRGRGAVRLIENTRAYYRDNDAASENFRALEQAEGDRLTEAKVIRFILRQEGVPDPENVPPAGRIIYLEEISGDTYANGLESRTVIRRDILPSYPDPSKPLKIQLTTDGFHRLRALVTLLPIFAQEANWQIAAEALYVPVLDDLTHERLVDYLQFLLGYPQDIADESRRFFITSEVEKIEFFGKDKIREGKPPTVEPLDFSQTAWPKEKVLELRNLFRDYLLVKERQDRPQPPRRSEMRKAAAEPKKELRDLERASFSLHRKVRTLLGRIGGADLGLHPKHPGGGFAQADPGIRVYAHALAKAGRIGFVPAEDAELLRVQVEKYLARGAGTQSQKALFQKIHQGLLAVRESKTALENLLSGRDEYAWQDAKQIRFSHPVDRRDYVYYGVVEIAERLAAVVEAQPETQEALNLRLREFLAAMTRWRDRQRTEQKLAFKLEAVLDIPDLFAAGYPHPKGARRYDFSGVAAALKRMAQLSQMGDKTRRRLENIAEHLFHLTQLEEQYTFEFMQEPVRSEARLSVQTIQEPVGRRAAPKHDMKEFVRGLLPPVSEAQVKGNVFVDGRELADLNSAQREELIKALAMNSRGLRFVIYNDRDSSAGGDKKLEVVYGFRHVIRTGTDAPTVFGRYERKGWVNVHLSLKRRGDELLRRLGMPNWKRVKFFLLDEEPGMIAVALLYAGTGGNVPGVDDREVFVSVSSELRAMIGQEYLNRLVIGWSA